jgi:D-alanyl-D-alanine dipeptidase
VRKQLFLLFLLAVASGVAQTPRIQPVRPIEEIRAEALRATPPSEVGHFRDSDLVDLTKFDSSLRFDIRYATPNNFLNTAIYQQPAAFLQRPAADALRRAATKLHSQGYGLLVFDAYRPWFVTKIFWDATPSKFHAYVADPAIGSRHNRGCAIDLTLFDLNTNQPVAMPTDFDDFSERAWPTYSGVTREQREHREILRRAMENEGFRVFRTEWWHYDYRDWRHYRTLNVPFSELPADKGEISNR